MPRCVGPRTSPLGPELEVGRQSGHDTEAPVSLLCAPCVGPGLTAAFVWPGVAPCPCRVKSLERHYTPSLSYDVRPLSSPQILGTPLPPKYFLVFNPVVTVSEPH